MQLRPVKMYYHPPYLIASRIILCDPPAGIPLSADLPRIPRLHPLQNGIRQYTFASLLPLPQDLLGFTSALPKPSR